MANYRIVVFVDAKRLDGLQTKLTKALQTVGVPADAVTTQIEKVKQPNSRSDRLSDCESSVSDAKSEVESLRDELQDWMDNLPENLQSGTKADELQSAIDQLEQIASDLNGIDWTVDFPGMF